MTIAEEPFSYSEILFQEPTILPDDFAIDDPVEILSNSSDTQVNSSVSDPLEPIPKYLDDSIVFGHIEDIQDMEVQGPRTSCEPTIYERFTENQIDWCRYVFFINQCGVTQRAQSAAFRPGPWGKRTLCNKHGCDYKGYGYIEKEPRLNLSSYEQENIKERIRPILQDWCARCYEPHSSSSDILVQCDGCFIEVPKKNLPLMRISPRTVAKKVAEKKRSRSSSEPLTCKKKKCNLPSEEITLSGIADTLAVECD